MDHHDLTVLLVTAAGQTFGVPVVQVERLSAMPPLGLNPPGEEPGGCSLAAGLGYPTPGRLSGKTVRTMLAKNGTHWTVEVVHELVSIPWVSLRRLPPLLAQHTRRAVWGAALLEDELILLLDLDRLTALE